MRIKYLRVVSEGGEKWWIGFQSAVYYPLSYKISKVQNYTLFRNDGWRSVTEGSRNHILPSIKNPTSSKNGREYRSSTSKGKKIYYHCAKNLPLHGKHINELRGTRLWSRWLKKKCVLITYRNAVTQQLHPQHTSPWSWDGVDHKKESG